MTQSIFSCLSHARQTVTESICSCVKTLSGSAGRIWKVITQYTNGCVAKAANLFASFFAKAQNSQEPPQPNRAIHEKKIITLAYCPFLKSYPESIQAVERSVRTALGNDVQITHRVVSENDPKTLRVKGDRILLFSMKESKRPDDANNYKPFFDSKRNGICGVALTRPREAIQPIAYSNYFKQIGSVFCVDSSREDELIAELKNGYQ